MNDYWNDPPEHDETCQVCGGASVDLCVCPECQSCGSVGDPSCYIERDNPLFVDNPNIRACGMVRTQEQDASYQKALREWEQEADREKEMAAVFSDWPE